MAISVLVINNHNNLFWILTRPERLPYTRVMQSVLVVSSVKSPFRATVRRPGLGPTQKCPVRLRDVKKNGRQSQALNAPATVRVLVRNPTGPEW